MIALTLITAVLLLSPPAEGDDLELLELRADVTGRLIETAEGNGSKSLLAEWLYGDYLRAVVDHPAMMKLENVKRFLEISRQYEAILNATGNDERARIAKLWDDRLGILHSVNQGGDLYEASLCAILRKYIESPGWEGWKVRKWLDKAIDRDVEITEAWRMLAPHVERVFDLKRGASGRWEGSARDEKLLKKLALAMGKETDLLAALLVHFDKKIRHGGEADLWWNTVLMNDVVRIIEEALVEARDVDHSDVMRFIKTFRDDSTQLSRLDEWWVPGAQMEGTRFHRLDRRGLPEKAYSYGYLLPLGTYEMECDIDTEFGSREVRCYASMEEERPLPFGRFREEFPKLYSKHRARLESCDVVFPLPSCLESLKDQGEESGWLYIRRSGLSREKIFGLLDDYVVENRDVVDNIDFTDILVFIFEYERDHHFEGITPDVNGFAQSRDLTSLRRILNGLSGDDVKKQDELKIENRSIFNDWVSVVSKIQADAFRDQKIILTFPEDLFSSGFIPDGFRNSLRLSMRDPGDDHVVIRPSYIIRDNDDG